jgi:hypothetical protein
MSKLYKLAGAAGGAFSCYGAKFGIRVNDVALLDGIIKMMPPFTRATSDRRVDTIYTFLSPPPSDNPRVRKFHLLYENSLLIKRGKQGSDLLEAFDNAINLNVSQRAMPYVFVHAGAVAWNGIAIVIPGSSRSGKSTLVSAFLRAGASYLSDEFAIFDRTGKVHPYPRAISIRSEPDAKTKLLPEHFGAELSTGPLPVGVVITTHFQQSSRWKPRRLSPGQAVLALLANGMSAQQRPPQNMQVLSAALSDAILLGGIRGEADDAVTQILNELQKRNFKSSISLTPRRNSDKRAAELETGQGK